MHPLRLTHSAPVSRSNHDQMEVVKTRMQLQGELVARRGSSARGPKGYLEGYRPPYRNVFDAFYKICRDEGLRGIQAGLAPGVVYQARFVWAEKTRCVVGTQQREVVRGVFISPTNRCAMSTKVEAGHLFCPFVFYACVRSYCTML